jgi:hypothetical protein
MKPLSVYRDDVLLHIHNLFSKYGAFIGNHARLAIIIPVLITCASCVGLLRVGGKGANATSLGTNPVLQFF